MISENTKIIKVSLDNLLKKMPTILSTRNKGMSAVSSLGIPIFVDKDGPTKIRLELT